MPAFSNPVAESRGAVGRGRRSRPFCVLVFLTARTDPNPEERPREAPGAHPAPGGRVHFAAQAGQLANCGWSGPLSFGGERPEVWEGDAISRRGGRDVVCSGVGGDAAEWSREQAHGVPRCSPPPVRFASKCCAISPFASSAGAHCARGRHRPRPPTSGHCEGGRWARGSGGGRGLHDVGGRGCPTLASGEERAGLPAGRGHGGRCTRLGLERQAQDTWARRQAPPPRPLSADWFLPASGSSRKVTLSCRGRLDLSRSRYGA